MKQILGGTPSGTLARSAAFVFSPLGVVAQATDLVIDNAAGLQLGIAEDHDPVKPGDALTYTVVLGNTAASALPARGGVISSTMPPGTTFASASPGGALTGGIVRWSFGSLNPGASLRFSYTVTVGSAVPDGTVLQASAQVTDGTFSLVRAQTATDVKTVMPLRLTVSVDHDPAPANLNALVTGLVPYEYKISNLGTTAIANIVLADFLIDDAQVVISSSTAGLACSNPFIDHCLAGSVFSWSIASLAAGQTATFVAMKQILGGTPSGTLARNAAFVSSPLGILAQATDLVVDNVAGLKMGLTQDHDPVKPGDALTYTLVLGNTAAAALPANGGVVFSTIPAGTTFASASVGGTASGNIVQWSLASIAPGANRTFSYTVSVGSAIPDGTVLQASAQASEGNLSLVRAQLAADVVGAPALTLSVAVTPGPVAGQATFTATIANADTFAVTNVVLSALTVNDAQVLLASSTPGATCTNEFINVCLAGAITSWTTPTLAAGQTVNFTWVSQVLNGTARGTILRTAVRARAGAATASQGRDLAVN
jgi:uncharacterized repeat protein (TIGR01451 family)